MSLYVKWVAEESKFKLVDLAFDKQSINESIPVEGK